MASPGENAQSREKAGPSFANEAEGAPAERLEWQSELDSALTDLDNRLRHPRRRASDMGEQPTLPQLGQVDLTSELLDEIAWRVSEQIRRTQPASAEPAKSATRPTQTAGARPVAPARATAPPPPEPENLPHGIALTIRIRKPLFRFFRRKRRQALISFADYRVT